MRNQQIKIDKERCIGCGLCTKVCVTHNIKFQDKKVETILNNCILCGQCTAICPKEAISINGYDTEQIEWNGEERLNPQKILDVIRFRRSTL